MRRIASWSMVLAIVVFGATPAWATEAAAQRISSRSMADQAGDVVDSEGAKLNDARGDILQALGEYKSDSIQFEVRIAQFADPVKDPNWNSDSTYLLWTLDTNGDSKGDFTIEYGNENGKLYGAVFRVGPADEAPAICTSPSMPTGPSGAYVFRLDPGCIGRPDSFAWSVEASYDTNSRDDDAPATEDLLPDKGFTPPLYAPAGSPASATGTAQSSPADGATSPGATAPAAATDTTSSELSSAGAAAGAPSGSRGEAPKTGGGSSSASASATAASSSSNQAPGASTREAGTPSGRDADATATASDGGADARRGSGSSLLIAIILAAGVMFLAVAGVLLRTIRSRGTGSVTPTN